MNTRALLTPVLLSAALLLSACGNKGPLLPPPAPDEDEWPADGFDDPGAEVRDDTDADADATDDVPLDADADTDLDGEGGDPAFDDDGDGGA